MPAVRISVELHDKLIAHALREAPNECCGLIEFDSANDAVVSVMPMVNVAASPMRFELASQDLLEIPQIEERGRLPVIYHSHPRSAPEPSLTDIKFAELWPGIPWAIVGLAEPGPEVRWFEIDGGQVAERQINRVAA